MKFAPRRSSNEPMGVARAERLLMLAFDHRASFQRSWFGITGTPTAGQLESIAEGKEMILEGLERAALARGSAAGLGALVDEQFGAPRDLPRRIRRAGLTLAMPVEGSGQREFEFEYGARFGEHIARFDPDFAKALVRYNPAGDQAMNRRQAQRLAGLSSWLQERGRRLLLELLVPPEEGQLQRVGGDRQRYDAELRPGLMLKAVAELQERGVEPHVWKLEGLARTSDYETVAAQCRANGRDHVACVVLGRGADAKRVEGWLREAALVPGFIGFAIGRSIWGKPLRALVAKELSRADAVEAVAGAFLHFAAEFEAAGASEAATTKLTDSP